MIELDHDWFMSALMGDQLLVRMHVSSDGGDQEATGVAVSYYNDDMAYYGFAVAYRYQEFTKFGRAELAFTWLREDSRGWHHEVALMFSDGPTAWYRPELVVCTTGRPYMGVRMSGHQVQPTHPIVLSHLARFQGVAGNPHIMRDGGRETGMNIVTRRLDGLVRKSSAEIARLFDPVITV